MTTLHQLTDNCLAVAGLPSDAVPMYTGFIGDELEYIRMDIPLHSSIKIPEGNWRILGKANELTDEQWKEVVHEGDAYPNEDRYGSGYMLYSDINIEENFFFFYIKATENKA